MLSFFIWLFFDETEAGGVNLIDEMKVSGQNMVLSGQNDQVNGQKPPANGQN
ncbi:hypothetical protein [Ureibacillus massiliensis]|uniref:hypothetical protein n=1 Tax=Ureibacillus massiliensis TaxID=292806 RepID=UPI000A705C98|nr:hypothetical protein [Ureibacillus massiliensis]